MPRPGVPGTSTVDTLHASAARTASGSGTAVFGFGKAAMIRAQIQVTAASGTSPTLNVVLEDTLDGTNWNTIGTFAQLTAAGREVINVVVPFGDQVRCRYTIGGTSPSFTFAVIAYTQ